MSGAPVLFGDEIVRLDVAVYAAIAATRHRPSTEASGGSPVRPTTRSCGPPSAAVLAAAGGATGRRAAVNGLASIAVTSASSTSCSSRSARGAARTDRGTAFPSPARSRCLARRRCPPGHAASASAFAAGVSTAAPGAGIPLGTMAALVSYSRVHTGVHYPLDVIAGTIAGNALAPVAVAALSRLRARRQR